MNPEDLALFRQLGAWAEELTGYPMVSGYEEFLYEPDTPLHGDLTDYAYHQRGAIAYVVELWDLFKQLGIERKKRFVDNYTHLTRDDMVKLAVWDRDKNAGRVGPSVAHVHASAAGRRRGRRHRSARRDVESAARGAAERVPRAVRRTTCASASLAPAVVVDAVETASAVAGAHARDRHRREPRLPARRTSWRRRRTLTHNEPLWADARCDGCELADPDLAHREIGHLDGWGRGLFDGSGALYYTRTPRHDRRAHALVGRARQGHGRAARRLVPRRLDDATRGRRLR